MKFAGVRTFSFVDYPKKISAVVYTAGCNFRCKWCHNWRIAYSKKFELVSEEKILEKLSYLKKRLSAVCITGGEPTIHIDLPAFVYKVKQMGYLIKLDTNGTNPQMIEMLLNQKLLDYVAVDIKASSKNYPKLTGISVNYWQFVSKTIDVLKGSKVEYEFRMTYVPGLSTTEDIKFFENLLSENEKGYITIANSTELFKVKFNEDRYKLNLTKLVLR
ncbi:anaerobic ribonucleoside-triphosphate reductase activating protein [Thermosipho atlanticus]|uniref:Pyruvate formate lyase activating enzyme n=1 Tax=Thermosipho atlanticus DSM 15807 TaxID=1123380 RepID=A0A1M5TCK6_9BACT|nr:anaerobic ribonucleoside-triphosphate reductase activating protein [Thermosipho atlanticus]SHH48083.1 pyruvate formate lyase activating enzyme [Thermosipho atlanticus DSM 15807]